MAQDVLYVCACISFDTMLNFDNDTSSNVLRCEDNGEYEEILPFPLA